MAASPRRSLFYEQTPIVVRLFDDNIDVTVRDRPRARVDEHSGFDPAVNISTLVPTAFAALTISSMVPRLSCENFEWT